MSLERSQYSYRKLISLEDQLKKIDQFADVAQEKIDYAEAHNDEVLQGIRIVEDFLRRRGRICYGGTAMNAYLPKKYKFYDPDNSIPDYDFLTTDSAADLAELEKDLRAEGFTEIAARPGMHEGTTKLFLNYVAIADLTEIDEGLYDIFKRKAHTLKGIAYMDINSLRMMMYLELSRPRGEVERWKKVYERLLLLQYVAPATACSNKDYNEIKVAAPIYSSIFHYGLNHDRVFAGASIVDLYQRSTRTKVSGNRLENSHFPIIFYSPSLEADAEQVSKLLGDTKDVATQMIESIGDYVPRMCVVKFAKRPVLLIVAETACHSFNTVKFGHEERQVRIASLDLLVTLYFSLELSPEKVLKKFFPMKIHCMAQEAIDISNYLRRFPLRSQWPFISLDCSGHQKGFASLLREKFERAAEAKRQRREKLLEDLSFSSSNRSSSTHSRKKSLKKTVKKPVKKTMKKTKSSKK